MSDTEREETSATPSVPLSTTMAAINLKLPPFWPTDPEVWFAQVEAQFTTKRIHSQKTCFDYVISSLSPGFATEVRDLLLNPPSDTPYDKLKTELIKRTAASEQCKLQQLIGGEELGDRKPTQLLQQMQQLLGDKLSSSAESFLREPFLQRLPPSVRMILASADSAMDLQKLADMADKVMEVTTPTVSAIPNTVHPQPSEIEQLRLEVKRLTDLVTSLIHHDRPHHQSTSRSCRPPTPSPQQSSSNDSICWYHAKFGDAAQKCKDPCTWGNTQAGR